MFVFLFDRVIIVRFVAQKHAWMHMKQNSFSSCRSCDFQFHFLALHLFRAIDACNVESQASTLCLKFFLQCCINEG